MNQSIDFKLIKRYLHRTPGWKLWVPILSTLLASTNALLCRRSLCLQPWILSVFIDFDPGLQIWWQRAQHQVFRVPGEGKLCQKDVPQIQPATFFGLSVVRSGNRRKVTGWFWRSLWVKTPGTLVCELRSLQTTTPGWLAPSKKNLSEVGPMTHCHHLVETSWLLKGSAFHLPKQSPFAEERAICRYWLLTGSTSSLCSFKHVFYRLGSQRGFLQSQRLKNPMKQEKSTTKELLPPS